MLNMLIMCYSYGSPLGNTISSINSNINPRLPEITQTQYIASGTERRVSVVGPNGEQIEDLQADHSEPDKIVLSEPGYE